MKKILTLVVALVLTIPMMAIGKNDGSTKANAIDFDWDSGVTHESGTKWYRVDLAPLYEEENPSLSLYLTNPSNVVGSSVDVSMTATVAGQTESKDYTIAARQYKTYTTNASMLVRMKQTEIYLTLTTDGTVKLSAKVFEAADLDESCKDAETLAWNTAVTQTPTYSSWWKVDLTPIKNASDKDAKITITNTGANTVNLKVGQSLDCPSSGTTTREFTLAVGESVIDTVPRSMIAAVQPDELYFGIENVESAVSILVEAVDQPSTPVIAADASYTELHVTDTIEPLPTGTTLYRIKVADMDSLSKYEPEFTYRNAGTASSKVTVKMAFELPAYGTTNTVYELASGEEEIVVYKKNMLEGLSGVEYIYLLTTVEGDPVNFYGRFKHVREGKACKTNIDFDWTNGHTQDANTTLWYAIDLSDAKAGVKDVVVNIQNLNSADKATVKASMAFSCPYTDLQEITRSIAAGNTATRTLSYSSYAMMSDTVWIGLETNQNIKFWATLQDAQTTEPDSLCLSAIDFDWEEGAKQNANDTVWYLIDMTEAREQAAKYPTAFIQNLSSTAAAEINVELSLECPDSIENEKRSLTIAAGESYSKQLSRNLFENITADTIYLRVVSTQDVSLQIRLTEEAEGASCSSAIPFNWVSGNSQAANANLWYSVDLREVMQRGNDLKLHLLNKENTAGKGVIQLAFECPVDAPSVEDFSLAANEEKTMTIQNSALETLEDSMIYVNLQGTTALRFWADTLAVTPFDTITGEGITLNTLVWDSLYTQKADTAWYIIPQSEIEKVKNLTEKVKPVAHLINPDTQENTYKVEAAFAFPIVKNMMTKNQKLSAGQHFSDTIPASTFDQFLKKDSIIIRITRPAGTADFQFKAELVSAFTGNTRADALPIILDKQYTQGANTEMWYKINTADLKADKTLFNKSLFVSSKNAGTTDATVTVYAYEGLLSETDMFEEFGLEDYRERTIKKGQGKSHNVPAQAVYGLGDVELYIMVRTTDSLVFESKFNGTYADQAVDPAQAEAKMLVPNVEYTIPGDNNDHWYLICMPYMQNNYEYTDASSLEYEVNGTATIEGTFTFQDEMDCDMPVRKRTINKAGGVRKGSKPLSELINKAIKRATDREFDVTTFQPSFIDSLLHRYITSDSITGYIRIKTDKDLKVKLNMVQTTGDQCTNPMAFDWEHGNVNPAGADTWYHVALDSLIVPDTCDLRLHVDNWAQADNNVQADLYFDCNDPATKSQSYTLAADGKDSIDIDRDFLVQLGWADMIINYNSDQVSHIWAELIPAAPRDTLRDTIVAYVCQGNDYLDTITNISHGPVDYSMQWYDTVTFQDGVVMKDSITLFDIHPLVVPAEITVDSMKKLGAAPLLVQGMQLFVDSSSVKLTEYYRNLADTVDTITAIDTVYWAKPVYTASGDLNPVKEDPLDLTSFYAKTDTQDTLLLVIKSDTCDFIYRKDIIFPIEDYKYVTKNDTACPTPTPVTSPDTIPFSTLVNDTLNLPRQIDTIVTHYVLKEPVLFTDAELNLKPSAVCTMPVDTTYTLSSLKQQFADAADELTMEVTDAYWQALDVDGTTWQDMPYTVPLTATQVTLRYIITTECGTQLTSGNVVITPTAAPCVNDTIVLPDTTVCGGFYWDLEADSLTTSGTYYHDDGFLPGSTTCKQFYQLTLTVNPTYAIDTTATVCDSLVWYGQTYTTSGTYVYNGTTAAGCDSIVTLELTVNQSAKIDTTAEVCDSIVWRGKTYTETGIYYDSLTTVVSGCDSIYTLNLTVNKSAATTKPTETVCNSYYWAEADTTITNTGTYTHVFQTVNGCDSVVTFEVTVNLPYVDTLEVKGYYGNRIIMINRIQINSIPGWENVELDSLDNGKDYVKWYKVSTPTDELVETGYYYTLSTGEPLPAGTYYATIEIPGADTTGCNAKGVTEQYVIAESSAAPALVPTLARPGEDIQVLNLNPEEETTIRIYTTEGLLRETYTVSDKTSFTIKAEYDHGFYLVELVSKDMKSTLRYIVK